MKGIIPELDTLKSGLGCFGTGVGIWILMVWPLILGLYIHDVYPNWSKFLIPFQFIWFIFLILWAATDEDGVLATD